MNEDCPTATVAESSATGEVKFSNTLQEQNEFSILPHGNSPEKSFSSIKQEQFVVPDDITEIEESETAPVSMTNHEEQQEEENIQIKINPTDFPLIEIEETPTNYDYVTIDDDECADPLRDTGSTGIPEVKIRADLNIRACNQCGAFYPATKKFHCPPVQDIPVVKKFECNYCSKVFLGEDLLEDHMFSHSSKQYICDRCGKFFARRDEFIEHERCHKSNVKCLQCRKTFEDKSMYDLHSQKGSFQNCPRCHVRLHSECSYNCHLLLHESDDKKQSSGIHRFSCDRCDETFASVLPLRDHYQIHSPGKPFKCQHCLFLFTNVVSLKRHWKKNTSCAIPGQPAKFACDRCNEAFAARCRLYVHELEMHGITRQISLVPNKPTKNSESVLKPPQIFEAARTVDFKEEDNKSNVMQNRRRNQKTTYTNGLQFAETFDDYLCKCCGQQFSTKDCRDQHERMVHRRNSRELEQKEQGNFSTVARDLSYAVVTAQLKSMPRPYKCPWCCRLCDSRVAFVEHYLTHTKEKPFVCDICNLGFIRACQLMRHGACHKNVRRDCADMKAIPDTRNSVQGPAKNIVKTYAKTFSRNDTNSHVKTYSKNNSKIDREHIVIIDTRSLAKIDGNAFVADKKILTGAAAKAVWNNDKTWPGTDSSRRIFDNNNMSPSNQIEDFSREPIVKLTKFKLPPDQDCVYVCEICYKYFALPISLLGHKKTCIHKKRMQLLQQSGKSAMSLKKQNHILRKTLSHNNHVFIDRFGIQHSIVFQDDRRFFFCGRCDRRFGRKDRLVRHSESHFNADSRRIGSNDTHFLIGAQKARSSAGPVARKSTMYRRSYAPYSKLSNVGPELGTAADWFYRSRIPDRFEISISENEPVPGNVSPSAAPQETNQETGIDSEMDFDEISLFEPQCIVKDEESDDDENLDFFPDDSGDGGENSARHFLEIDMTRSDYNSSVGESDYTGSLDAGGYGTSAGETDYDCRVEEANRRDSVANGSPEYSSIENIIMPEDDHWVCAQCNATFARRQDLIQHYFVHKDETSFKCIYCDREFTKRKYLTRHARRHIKKTKHNCLKCDQNFDTPAELERHECDRSDTVVVCLSGLSKIS